jgi:proteasome lid subunit RPN8/RPN11
MDIVLIGQIHSHPGTFVDLSLVDIKYGMTTPHYLSVVAPHYAQDLRSEWGDCGVHVYEPPHGFRRMHTAEVRKRIGVMAGVTALLTRLGGSP